MYVYYSASKMLFKFTMVLVNLLLIIAVGCKANEVATNFNKTKSTLEEAVTSNNVSRPNSLYHLTNKLPASLIHNLENGNQTNGPNSETSRSYLAKNNVSRVDSLHELINKLLNALLQNTDVHVEKTGNPTMQNASSKASLSLKGSARKAHKQWPENCAEAMDSNSIYGIVKIKIDDSKRKPLEVVCKRDDKGIPWLIIQRRSNGIIDFFRKMKEYEKGFGDLFNEFFLGLKHIYALTSASQQELWIQLEDWEGEQRWAKYSNFEIGDAKSGYKLKSVGQYRGNVSDSFTYHLGNKWSTKDYGRKQNCANKYKGAWWYKGCYKCNLNGLYAPEQYGQGIVWKSWHGFGYSLKYVHMAIRPVLGK